MQRKLVTILFSAAAALVMAGPAQARQCGEGQSEAVLVTTNGSVTICVDDEIAESPNASTALELQPVECPCADYTLSARDWRRVRDSQTCVATPSSIKVEAMDERSKGQTPQEEVWTFYAGASGQECSFQIRVNGLLHQSTRMLIPNQEAAQACYTFGRELYSDFAGSRKSPAECAEQE